MKLMSIFEPVQRQALQHAHGRIAGAEVVDGDAHLPRALMRERMWAEASGCFMMEDSVISSTRALGGRSAAARAWSTCSVSPLARELPGREVHGKGQALPRREGSA